MNHTKKVVLLGHFGIGKTSLLRRFIDNSFSEDYLVTVGVHVKKKEIELAGNNVSLIIWDIEGNTAIEKARKSYLLGTHGFIYVFDISRPETYKNIAEELQYLEDTFPKTPVVIVGNKSDLFGDSFTKEFFKDNHFMDCIFCSAKTGDEVDSIFTAISKKMVQ